MSTCTHSPTAEIRLRHGLALALVLALSPSVWASPAHPEAPPRGDGWSVLGGAVDQIVEDIVVAPDDDVYIAGHFNRAGTATAPNGTYADARWDGAAWTVLGAANDWIFALALAPDGTLYAAGRFTQIGGVAASRVARWDGTAWSAMGPGFNNPPNALIVDSNGVLYAAGGMNVVGGGSARAIFQWTGSEWVVPGGGLGVDNTPYSLALDAQDNLYVGGAFSSVSGVPARNVARWDGTSWSGVGGGTQTVGALVYALEFDRNGALYAGGTFTEMGGVGVNHLARWDGTAWADVAGGVAGSTGGGTAVRAIAFDGADRLYIGGSFQTAGGVSVNGVARWDGAAWGALAGGVENGVVLDLAVARNLPRLYAGGGFSSIGGVSGLNYFAQYEGDVTSPSEPVAVPTGADLALVAPWPNPLRGGATVRVAAERSQHVRLSVLDATGRRVAVLFDGAVAAGQSVDVRLDGADLPSGTYGLQLSGERGVVARRFTVVR